MITSQQIEGGNLEPVVVTGGLTDAELRATPVPVSGDFATDGLTDTELRASPVPVSGPLTDAQLRASPVDINGTFTPSGTQDVNLVSTVPVPVTDNGGSLTIDGTVAVSNPGLTDTQLRATPVPVSGPLTDTQLRATAVLVSGPLTDAELRAAVIPVTEAGANATVLPLVLVANTSAQLLAANPARKGFIISTTGQPVYIKFGATASTTSWTYKVTANNTTTEVFGLYSGRVDIMAQNGQTVNITEVTA